MIPLFCDSVVNRLPLKGGTLLYLLIRIVLMSGQEATMGFGTECCVVSFRYSSAEMVSQSTIPSDSNLSLSVY